MAKAPITRRPTDPPHITISCGTCAYWHPPIPDAVIGDCRRYPPTLIDMNQRLTGRMPERLLRSARPATPADEVCGEFKAHA